MPHGHQDQREALSSRGPWWSDFAVSGGRIRLRKSGTGLRLDATLIVDAAKWFGWWLAVLWASRAARAAGDRRPAILFQPDTPRPWYVIRPTPPRPPPPSASRT